MADNEALLDAILYDWYPHALPGELDDMDMLRFWRMVEAKSVMSAEDERKRFYEGDAKPPTTKDGAKWRQYQRNVKAWAEHDKLLREAGLMDND